MLEKAKRLFNRSLNSFLFYKRSTFFLFFIHFFCVRILLASKKVVLFNKLHPIYSDFFLNYKSETVTWFYFAPKWKNYFWGKIALKYTDILHLDHSAFSEEYLKFRKKTIIECEGLAKEMLFEDPRIHALIFESKYSGRKQLGRPKSALVYPAVKNYRNLKMTRKNELFTIISVGFGSFLKGFDVSFEVFKRLKQEGYKVKLIIAGTMGHNFEDYPEADRNAYERSCRLISEMQEYSKNHDDLVVKAFRKYEMIDNLYPQADVLLHPCRMETFGFTVLEALSFGIPVVSVKLKAIPEMVKHGYNGYLINSFDWDGINPINEDAMNTTTWFDVTVVESVKYLKRIHELKQFNLDPQFTFTNRMRNLEKIYFS
jgi:glycosyltransferase involved in cell wall biosynthesis